MSTSFMSQRQVAAALGISRTLLQHIEACAIEKLLIGLGIEPPPLAHWRKPYLRRTLYKCSRCGGRGHNVRGCTEAERVR